MGSVHEWRVVLVSGIRIHLGIRLSLGMDALPLRKLDVRTRYGLGVAAGRVEYVGECAAVYGHVRDTGNGSEASCSRNGEDGFRGQGSDGYCDAAKPYHPKLWHGWTRDSARLDQSSQPSEPGSGETRFRAGAAGSSICGEFSAIRWIQRSATRIDGWPIPAWFDVGRTAARFDVERTAGTQRSGPIRGTTFCSSCRSASLNNVDSLPGGASQCEALSAIGQPPRHIQPPSRDRQRRRRRLRTSPVLLS